MSPELMYFMLMQASIFAVGAASVAFGVLLHHRPRRWWAYALVKAGLMTVIGTILFVVWGSGEVEPLPRAYIYVAGVLASAVGMSFVAGDLAKRGGYTSAEQVVRDAVEDTRGERVTALEDRVTAEEARNTDIEERADRAEAREGGEDGELR